MALSEACIEQIAIFAYTIPTDAPEADGTLAWDSTTLVLAEIRAGGVVWYWLYLWQRRNRNAGKTTGRMCLMRMRAFGIPALHTAMLEEVRNEGSRDIGAMAISALDIALCDLKARLLDCSVLELLGRSHPSVAVYGSGGFTSYSDADGSRAAPRW